MKSNLDGCPKVICCFREGKKPLQHHVQSKKRFLAAVPKGFSCPSHPSCCVLVRFPIQRKCLLISPVTSFFCLGHLSAFRDPLVVKDPLVSQGCPAFKDLLVSPFEAPGTANTSPRCLPGSYFPMALMRPYVPVQLLTACAWLLIPFPIAVVPTPTTCLILVQLKVTAHPVCNQSCSFSIMPLTDQF